MIESNPVLHYAFGNTEAERERLIRQAGRLAPLTERLFREAGIGPGQHVLDLGSGAGDVTMLLARLVGPSGEVVGIERDASSIALARARAVEAGLHNVSFMLGDVTQIAVSQRFDAAVGRLILEFVPDPVAVLRSASQLVRAGGAVAFHEVSHAPFLALVAHLPLWSAAAAVLIETLKRTGANSETGLTLARVFQQAGLPSPRVHMEIVMGTDPDFRRWMFDVLCSLWPKIQSFNLSLEALGDLDTLQDRLQAEAAASATILPYTALVGAWSRTPADRQ